MDHRQWSAPFSRWEHWSSGKLRSSPRSRSYCMSHSCLKACPHSHKACCASLVHTAQLWVTGAPEEPTWKLQGVPEHPLHKCHPEVSIEASFLLILTSDNNPFSSPWHQDSPIGLFVYSQAKHCTLESKERSDAKEAPPTVGSEHERIIRRGAPNWLRFSQLTTCRGGRNRQAINLLYPSHQKKNEG